MSLCGTGRRQRRRVPRQSGASSSRRAQVVTGAHAMITHVVDQEMIVTIWCDHEAALGLVKETWSDRARLLLLFLCNRVYKASGVRM